MQCATQCIEVAVELSLNLLATPFTWPWKIWVPSYPWPLQSPKSRPKQTIKSFGTLLFIWCLYFMIHCANLKFIHFYESYVWLYPLSTTGARAPKLKCRGPVPPFPVVPTPLHYQFTNVWNIIQAVSNQPCDEIQNFIVKSTWRIRFYIAKYCRIAIG